MNTPILATSQPVSPTEQLLQQHLQQAWQALKQQDTAAAMLAAKNATSISPDSPELAHVLGVLAMRDDRLDLALPLLQKALNGQVTAKKLLDMAQALLLNQQVAMALTAVNDALAQFGNTSEALGLKSAIEVALEDWAAAKQSAQTAIALNPSLMAWESNLGFCQLMQAEFKTGLQSLTGRSDNLPTGSRAPAFNTAKPFVLWLKNEQGPGDTLFNLRYAPMLVEQGYQLHIQTDKKTKTLLRNTGLFASVKEDFTCPNEAFWLNVGDLPLAGMQATGQEIVPPLPLNPEPERMEKLRKRLAEIGPAPYLAVTWRAGPKGKKLRNGLRAFTKGVAPEWLGESLKHTKATIISLQRLPTAEENAAFKQGLGRGFADLSLLNDQLQDMLALLSLMDAYITVPNTNLHLRESLGLSSMVFVNRPFQDWRWLAEGDTSPWYPNSTIIRQEKNGHWERATPALAQYLTTKIGQKITHQTVNVAMHQEIVVQAHSDESLKELLEEGWQAVNQGQIAAAIKVAQHVLQKAPDYPEALHLLGWAAYRDLKGDIALALLKKATELAPSNGAALGDYIRALTANRQYDDALQLANAALQASDIDNLHGIYYARAAVNLQLNQLHDAIADYDACLAIKPNYLDALAFNGLARLKVGDAYQGFRYYSARPEARTPARMDGLVCPWLRGDVQGLKVLIKRDMGLGDELSFLRYIPWLIEAGVHVTYWAGKKLVPLLTRMKYASLVLSDDQEAPETEAYDLTFWVHELPVAVETLNAPEIAPSLELSPLPELVEKWKQWLCKQGPAPYIGVNWKAGIGTAGAAGKFSKLSKEVNAQSLANALKHIDGTVISLQRNVMLEELSAFEQALGRPVHDAVCLTDELEDLLALQSLLDENIGVSNTNMHLRAGLGLGSRVLVQCPGGDWRWGYEGSSSLWFEHSKVYRQELDGHWTSALHELSQDLTAQYPQKVSQLSNVAIPSANQTHVNKVIWLTAGKLEATATGYTSDLASARYRVILPAAELTHTGLKNVFVNESISQAMGGWGSHTPQSGDTLIISKVFTSHALALANDAKKRGATVVVDFCDNFFDHPTRGPLQKALLAVADQVVASTEAMAEVLATQGKPANAVISDPVELAQGKAKFSPSNTLKLLWFGHAVNIDTLAQCLAQLAELSLTKPLCLNVVTTLPNGADDLAKIVPVGLDVRYTPWSVAATKTAIDDCDLVIIPTIATELKKAKSPNRLLEPLWAGRMVVAGRLPAYLPFGDSAWVGKDIIQGVQWALNNPQSVVKRIQQGQQDIADYFSQTAIANAWMQVIVPKSNSPKSNAPATKAPVLTHMNPQAPSVLTQKRLNLGCGDKILPGYINVDVVASRAGKTPDVLCDLHHLSPFEDNTVDEVLSVHVVEHFWRWEVLDILKEWVRVLKPGGKMVLECPNLLSACEEFLKNPEAAAFGGPEGQRSMWVFYGDPRWKDPYMVHRWGYTPQSLSKLMQEAGLVNARQMPAQYKLKEPRDMRIEAYKP